MAITVYINKLKLLFKVVFSNQTEFSAIANRSLGRYRQIGRSAISSLAARAINIFTGLLTIPLLLSYLGPDRFGLWMVIINFVGLLSFADLGLGVGLQNSLTESYGLNDNVNPRSYVSSAMLILGFISICFVLAGLYVLPSLPLYELVKTKSDLARAEILPTNQALMIIFGLGFITSLTERIANAYQEGYVASICMAIGRIFSFIGLLVCIQLNLGLPFLIATFVGTPMVFMAMGGVMLIKNKPWLSPSIAAVNKRSIRKIFGIGVSAVGSQLAFLLLNMAPLIIIGNEIGASAVVPYAVTQKLLGTSGILLKTVITPFWPAYGEAAARNDWGWVRKNFSRTIRLGAMIQLPIFVVMALCGQWIIKIWTNDNGAVPDWSLLMACNIWYLIFMWNSVASMFLNGINRMAGQATLGLMITVAGVLSGYWYSSSTNNVASIIWLILLAGMLPRGLAMLIEIILVLKKSKKIMVINQYDHASDELAA